MAQPPQPASAPANSDSTSLNLARQDRLSLKSVDTLLQRASEAVQKKNYSGLVTYEFGSNLETLELVHLVKEGVEYERIQHLSGVEREFVRSGRSLDCVSAGGMLLRGGLSQSAGSVTLAQNYHFYIRGDDRIAGREASVVQVVPKDEYRYGMTLALDKDSGLPLMSLITSSGKSALERFQFVELEVGNDIDESKLEPTLPSFKRLDGKQHGCQSLPQDEAHWAATWLPEGFVLASSQYNKERGEVLTYTDGIASFSLFVSPMTSAETFKQGLARRGATVALLSSLPLNQQPVSVIFVGEVPSNTAQRVVSSIRPLN